MARVLATVPVPCEMAVVVVSPCVPRFQEGHRNASARACDGVIRERLGGRGIAATSDLLAQPHAGISPTPDKNRGGQEPVSSAAGWRAARDGGGLSPIRVAIPFVLAASCRAPGSRSRRPGDPNSGTGMSRPAGRRPAAGSPRVGDLRVLPRQSVVGSQVAGRNVAEIRRVERRIADVAVIGGILQDRHWCSRVGGPAGDHPRSRRAAPE